MSQSAIRNPQSAIAEASGMTPYLWALMAMLVSATVFDAFSLAILSTVAPIVQELWGLTNTQWGLVNLIIRVGAVVSFFILMLADRFGRRPVIIIGEEYPTRWRSFGISLLGGIGALGTIIAFLTARSVLAHYDWRTMYLLGLIPVALVFFFRLGMREARRFDMLREEGRAHTTSLRQQLAGLRVPFQRRYRARSLLVTLIWNCSHMVTSPAITFWTIHAHRDLGLGPQQYTVVVAAGYLFGFLVGAPTAGLLMNLLGRRLTCALYYLGAGLAIFTLFQIDSRDLVLQTVVMAVNIFFFLGAGASTNTFATELFPTEI